MTTPELRDWHALRDGWQLMEFTSGKWYWVKDNIATHELFTHPFPATIDGAASAMPPGWDWSKDEDGWQTWEKGSMMQNIGIDDTGDEIHDRYLLAKIAWQELAASK